MKKERLDSYQDCIELPLVTSRELVVFPHMIVPYFSSASEISAGIERAMEQNRLVFFAFPKAQRGDDSDESENELCTVGTVVKILQIFKLKNDSIRMLAESLYRAEIQSTHTASDEIAFARIKPILEHKIIDSDISLLMSNLRESFETYGSYLKKMPSEIAKKVNDAEHGDELVDIICSYVPFQREIKLELLQLTDTVERLRQLSILLETEIEMKKLQGEIQNRVKEKLERAQKEYFLNEQIRQINKELGKEQDEADEADELLKRIKARNPSDEIIEKASKEANRLRKLQAMAPEYGVIRTYLEWLGDLPWSETTEDNYDIIRAKQIMDEDHYNMIKPKERILDYLAVRSIQKQIKGPILCLVGPPGTGKTSLGKSVARTMGRAFIRISLGGIRDEAEIRGHRKTYVGALPGKIIQSMKKAGTKNPVFLLDEIDKMGSDFRGDPSSALLEVLDPEQNSAFNDHYLEVPYDLSQVLFIATANSLHTIPAPLRDRMEIIEIPGYSDFEKLAIATQFLIPKQLRENGLTEETIVFRKDAIMRLIHDYTMESGVRNLERTIATVIRKIARMYVINQQGTHKIDHFKKIITAKNLLKILGKPLYTNDLINTIPTPGLANGLAWTEMGGRLLSVEAVLMPGSGKLILTGNLGDVMKESARISLSYIQSHSKELSIDPEIVNSHDIHIHVPQGAIPKDGPSAGITLCTALFSVFTNTPVPIKYSMTGEITLTGRILAIGGVKEKILASYRNGIKHIILPEKNRKDAMEDLPKKVLDDISIYYVKTIQETLQILFPEICNTKTRSNN